MQPGPMTLGPSGGPTPSRRAASGEQGRLSLSKHRPPCRPGCLRNPEQQLGRGWQLSVMTEKKWTQRRGVTTSGSGRGRRCPSRPTAGLSQGQAVTIRPGSSYGECGLREQQQAGKSDRIAPVEQRVRVDHRLSLRLPSMDSNPALFQNLPPIPICCEAMLL